MDEIDQVIEYENELKAMLKTWAVTIPFETRPQAGTAQQNIALSFYEEGQLPYFSVPKTFEDYWFDE